MAAQSGTAYFLGLSSRQTYTKSLYFDDTAGNLVRYGAGTKAGATSPDAWIAPENVVLYDLCLAAATAQTTTGLQVNGQPTGDYLTNALHLVSVTNRPRLQKMFPAGYRIEMIQVA